MKQLIRASLRRLGYDIINVRFREAQARAQVRSGPVDFAPEDIKDIAAVRPFTMVSEERLYTLGQAVRYVVQNDIPGAFVECGVWRGGCCMLMARNLLRLGVKDRDLYLFDLFDLPWPGVTQHDSVKGDLAGFQSAMGITSEDMVVSADTVRRNIESTGYPAERIHLVRGMVEETLPGHAPEEIAILRLDTDLYESTKHELEALYPLLSRGGAVIIDDYGTWAGSQKAVDDYFAAQAIHPLLMRVDHSGRMGIKT